MALNNPKGANMKKQYVLLNAAAATIALTLIFWTLTGAQSPSDSQPEGATSSPAQSTASFGTDSNPTEAPEVFIPARYMPNEASAASITNDIPVATVYFTPQDENTSNTVLFLYNTSTTTATVSIQTFRLNGTQFINTSLDVPPGELVRISGDSVSTISASWQDVVLVNFTTSSTYAKMTLPAGVKADGFVVWNNGSTYDPLQVAPTLPLRFSSDPTTVFLPALQDN
jgi:hypothetical protein